MSYRLICCWHLSLMGIPLFLKCRYEWENQPREKLTGCGSFPFEPSQDGLRVFLVPVIFAIVTEGSNILCKKLVVILRKRVTKVRIPVGLLLFLLL